MITCNKIKADIISDSFCGCYVWEYNGENCGIDPIGTKEGMTFHIWYGSKPDSLTQDILEKSLLRKFFQISESTEGDSVSDRVKKMLEEQMKLLFELSRKESTEPDELIVYTTAMIYLAKVLAAGHSDIDADCVAESLTKILRNTSNMNS